MKQQKIILLSAILLFCTLLLLWAYFLNEVWFITSGAKGQNGSIAEIGISEGTTLLPISRPPQFQVVGTVLATITSYSSSEDETDSTPFITASGKRVKEGIIANNCFDYGTLVEIDGKIYEVQDRLNERYSCQHFDIWQPTKEEAQNFGKKVVEVKIVR